MHQLKNNPTLIKNWIAAGLNVGDNNWWRSTLRTHAPSILNKRPYEVSFLSLSIFKNIGDCSSLELVTSILFSSIESAPHHQMKLSLSGDFSLNISDDQFLGALIFCVSGSLNNLRRHIMWCLSRLIRTESNRMALSHNMGMSKGKILISCIWSLKEWPKLHLYDLGWIVLAVDIFVNAKYEEIFWLCFSLFYRRSFGQNNLQEKHLFFPQTYL